MDIYAQTFLVSYLHFPFLRFRVRWILTLRSGVSPSLLLIDVGHQSPGPCLQWNCFSLTPKRKTERKTLWHSPFAAQQFSGVNSSLQRSRLFEIKLPLWYFVRICGNSIDGFLFSNKNWGVSSARKLIKYIKVKTTTNDAVNAERRSLRCNLYCECESRT